MKILLSLFLVLVTGCTSLHTVSLTTIPAQRTRVVRAETSKTVFLGFTFDNDFVDEMESQLKNQCPNGVVSGILTKDEVIDYFLFIVWKQKVSATGYCIKSATASISKDPRHPSSSEEVDESGEPL